MPREIARAKWFKHDNDARHDPKMIKLKAKFGHEGLGIFWEVCEALHESQRGDMLIGDLLALSYEMRVDLDKLTDIVNYCIKLELFESDTNDKFWSNRTKKELDNYFDMCERNKKAGKISAKNKASSTLRQHDVNTMLKPQHDVNTPLNLIVEQNKKLLGSKAQELQSLPGSDFPKQQGDAHYHPLGSGLATPNPPQGGVSADADKPPVLVSPSSIKNDEEENQDPFADQKEKSDASFKTRQLAAERDALLAEMKRRLKRRDFSDNQKFQKILGSQLLQLRDELGEVDFWMRVDDIAKNEFIMQNMGGLKYAHGQIKSWNVTEETIFDTNKTLLKYLYANAKPSFDPEFERNINPDDLKQKDFIESEMNRTNKLCEERMKRIPPEFKTLYKEIFDFNRNVYDVSRWCLSTEVTKKLYDLVRSEGIILGRPFWRWHYNKLDQTIEELEKNRWALGVASGVGGAVITSP